MKKSGGKGITERHGDLPAPVMEGLRQAFQKPASPDLSCPDPEMVIGCALGELEAALAQQVQAHVLTCRDCLDLFLDVRLARAEAETPGEEDLASQPTGRLAALGQKVQETLRTLLKPRRLIPALATVSLVALVFILGREDRSNVLPPPQLALEQRQAPMQDTVADASPGTSAASPAPAPMERQPLASKLQFENSVSARKKSAAPMASLSATKALRLEFHEVQDRGGRRLSYRADRDVFAYLLQQDGSGQITRLFAGRLEGGKTYFYPAAHRLRQSDPGARRATIYLVASEQPLAELPPALPKLEDHGLQQMQRLFPDAIIRSRPVTLP